MPKFASWNIEKGGYTTYADKQPMRPEKEAEVTRGLRTLASKGIDSFTLLDVNRWNELYDGEVGIAEHVGTQRAFHVRLDDARLNAKYGEDIGIVFATSQPVASHDTLDLGKRNALSVILNIGKHGLQLVSVYFDDISEDDRIEQSRALKSEIKPDVPTALVGDFNGLRRDLANAPRVHRLANAAMKAVRILPSSNELVRTIQQMNRRLVVPEILASGYVDSDAMRQRPTAPAKFPVFGVDYALHSPSAQVTDFDVPYDNVYADASDHYPVVFDIDV